MLYRERITDKELHRKLHASGAVLIKGAKACGKTESAKQLSQSILQVDRDDQVDALMHSAPKRLLMGDTPRLIDEWQVQPNFGTTSGTKLMTVRKMHSSSLPVQPIQRKR